MMLKDGGGGSCRARDLRQVLFVKRTVEAVLLPVTLGEPGDALQEDPKDITCQRTRAELSCLALGSLQRIKCVLSAEKLGAERAVWPVLRRNLTEVASSQAVPVEISKSTRVAHDCHFGQERVATIVERIKSL